MSVRPDVDREAAERICQEFGLDLLILFGSRASGRDHRESDLDLGFVRKAGRLDPRHRLELQAKLASLLPGELDLVDLGRAPGLLRHSAAERGVLLHESAPGAFITFRVQAWSLYQDERVQIRRHDAAALRAAVRSLSP